MDYSLLLGIHNIDQSMRDAEAMAKVLFCVFCFLFFVVFVTSCFIFYLGRSRDCRCTGFGFGCLRFYAVR